MIVVIPDRPAAPTCEPRDWSVWFVPHSIRGQPNVIRRDLSRRQAIGDAAEMEHAIRTGWHKDRGTYAAMPDVIG